MSKMFENCNNLISVTIPSNFGSNSTSFEKMFSGCSEITTLDLTNLNTSLVTGTGLNNMFDGCERLATLALGNNFKTNTATELKSMFNDCVALTSLTFPTNFNTSSITNISNAFSGCTALRSVTGNNILINAATNTSNMFENCTSLTSIDLKGSTFANLNNTSNMFNGCSSLTEIKVNTNIRNLPAGATTTNMFSGCTNLKGAGGFKYDPNHTDGEYARVDYGGILPGYFTCANDSVYNTVHIDVDKTWSDNITKSNIRKITFSTSSTIDDYQSEFDLRTLDISLNTKGYLKDGGQTLLIHIAPQIRHLTADVDWSEFFANFTNLLSIENFSVVDTTNVTDASKAFYNCSSLPTINMTDIVIENIENLESAFEGCSSLVGYTGRIATFSSLQNAKNTFKNCTSLQIISFDICDTPTLQTTEGMFSGCTNLSRIYINKNFHGLAGITYDDMFKDCVNLVGGQGFGYNATDPNAGSGEFARIDYGGIMPGYYTLMDTSLYNSVTFTVPIDWFHSVTASKSDITEIEFFNDAPVFGGGSAVGHYDEMFYIDPVDRSRAYIDGTKVKFHYGHSINQLKLDGDASGFFKDFTNLTRVEGLEDKVDVTNVTNISELFSGCTSLVDISFNPNTEHVTNMEKVFYGCENLETVTIGSNLKLDRVRSLESAFEGCKKLSTLNIGIASFSSVENLKNAFKDCESLTVFSFDVCDTPTLATTSGMFSGCKNLRRIYVNDNFQGLQHIDYDNMFDGCINLIGGQGFTYSDSVEACKSGEFARVDYGGIMPGYYTILNTDKYRDVTFDLETDWYKSTTLPKEEVLKIEVFNTPQSLGGVGAYDEMFYMSDDDKTRAYVDTATKTVKIHYGNDIDTLKFRGDVEGMFKDFSSLVEIKGIDNLDASRIENMSNLFANCKNLKQVVIPNGLINAATFSEAFKNCENLEYVQFGAGVEVQNVHNLDGMFENCKQLKAVDFGTSFDISNVTSMERMFKNCSSLTTILFNQRLDTGRIESTREMFAGCTSLTNDSMMAVASLDVRNVKDMGYMFASCSNIQTVNLAGFEANELTNMEGMFSGCDNLTTIVFGDEFDTSKVTTMSHMFDGCSKLTGVPLKPNASNENTRSNNFISRLLKAGEESIDNYNFLDLSSLNTDSVVDTSGMFNNCNNINVIDISNMNTENVVDMSDMFNNCSELVYIVSNDFATRSVITSTNMFGNCKKLIGGEGTKWINTKKLDNEYAVADMGPNSSKPGYFVWGNAYITYNGGEGATGTMGKETVQRFKSHKLASNTFTKAGYDFDVWVDDNGNSYEDEKELNIVSSMNLTAMWKKHSSGGNGGGSNNNGGGTSRVNDGDDDSNNDMKMTPFYDPNNDKYVTEIDFVFHTVIDHNDFEWSYDAGNERDGVKLKKTSNVAKALMSNAGYASRYIDDGQSDYINLKSGFYNIEYSGGDFYFGFDDKGKLITGFIVTTIKTGDYELNSMNNAIIEIGRKDSAKYYLYNDKDVCKGIVWNRPIVVSRIEYNFDEQGRVTSERVARGTNNITDSSLFTNGIWEYNPIGNEWRYFVNDVNGKRMYLNDCIAGIKDNEGREHYYIFGLDGVMKKGLTEYMGKTYYLSESGAYEGSMYTGDITLNGNDYVFDTDGIMVKGLSNTQ